MEDGLQNEQKSAQASRQYTGRTVPSIAPLLLFRSLMLQCGNVLSLQAGKPWAINSSGNSVLHLICSMEKADDTPVNCTALMSFL